MIGYGVVIEPGPDGVGAYLPDVPGLGVVGDDEHEAIALLDKALQWHIDSLIDSGEELPVPSALECKWFLIPELFFLRMAPEVERFTYHRSDRVESVGSSALQLVPSW